MTGHVTYDAVIVGAGLSGLYAGTLLKGAGVSVVVLEGRSRIAGRQWTQRNGDFGYADMGAAYIGHTQTKVLEVMDTLGLSKYKVFTGHKSALSMKCGRQLYDSGIPSFKNPLILLDLNNVIRKLDSMSKQVPIEAPWEHPQAEQWDSVTVQHFLDQNLWTKEGKFLATVAIRAPFLVEPHQMSLLYLLHEVRVNGGMQVLISITNGLQEYKVLGGSSQISEKLAQLLPGLIEVDKYVSSITEIEGGVEVTTQDGSTYTAKKAIVSVPLPAISNIQFRPELPQYMTKLISIKPACQCIKTFTFYEAAFWREYGLNGELVSEEGIVTYAIDDTKPDGSYPAIMGFIDGEKAVKYSALSQDERKDLITRQYASEFGLDQFLWSSHYTEKYWQDSEEQRYSGSCCVWSLPPGVITQVRRFSSPKHPCGNVYFTGTESALTSRGYMDGALRSGHCVAAQVCRSLGKDMNYDDKEFSTEVPYIELSTMEKYLPSIPVFIVLCNCVVLGVIILGVTAVILYFAIT